MKILQIGMGNVAGGLEAFVINYYRVLVHMDIQFDFVCMYDKIAYEEEIRKLGGRIYYIPNVKKNYQGYIKELKKILKETKYDAVNVNMLSAANIVPLRVAHTMKVPKIIAHSHSSSCPGLIRKIMDNWNRPKIAKYATDRIACGEMAHPQKQTETEKHPKQINTCGYSPVYRQNIPYLPVLSALFSLLSLCTDLPLDLPDTASHLFFQKKTEIHSERNWDGKIKQ